MPNIPCSPPPSVRTVHDRGVWDAPAALFDSIFC
jgi:hypothetical protein